MKNRIIAVILCLGLILSMIPAGNAAESESTQPVGIAISTVEQLNMIGYEYPLDGSYYLTNDIDMTAATSKNGDFYNEGLGWEPIGSESTPFTGTFDGDGYSIIGMYINRPEEYGGLFSKLKGGEIRNIILRKCDVAAASAGAIVGYVEDGMVSNCYVESGKVMGRYCVGGIVGEMRGFESCVIQNCSNFATVDGEIGLARVGGIVGHAGITGSTTGNLTSIQSCINKGEVRQTVNETNLTDEENYRSGICGYIYEGRISKCVNYGNISAGAGICRANSTRIEDCANYGNCAYGIVYTDTDRSGDNGTVSRCFNAGECWIGIGKGCGTFTDCYTLHGKYAFEKIYFYQSGTSYYGTYKNCYNVGGGIAEGGRNSTNCYYVADFYSDGEKRNARQMTVQSTFANWDFENVWTMGGNEDYLYPELRDVPMEYTKSLIGIAMAVEPNKLSYIEGKENLDLTGAKLTLKYDNTTTEKIDITADMVSGFDNTKVGSQTLKVSYGGFETSFDVIILAKTLSSIVLTTLPDKLAYLEGKDELDVTGGIITRYYNNDTSDTLELMASMVSGFDNTVVGPQELTVTVGNVKTSYEIEIIAKTMTQIAVTKLPTKTQYLEGKETLNLTGGKITLYYDNDSTKEIPLSDATVTGFNKNKVGKQTLTAWYDGFSASFEVEIIAKSVRSIVVSTLPNTLSYLEGKDSLDVTGGKITVFYNNDTQEVLDLSVDMISGFANTEVGLQVLTVTFGGKTAVYEIEVVAKKLMYIEVTTLPAKLTYREHKDTLNVTGGRITLYFNNDTTEEIAMTADMVSGFNNTIIGKQTLRVTYEGKTATYEVEIIEKRLVAITIASLPTKQTYLEGKEALDVSGGKITLYYDNDSEENINMTVDMITGFDNTKVGAQTLTVTYGGKTANFTIEVVHVHNYSEEVIAPTCTAKGYTLHTCSACGDHYKDTYVDATGHAWDSGIVTTEPSCTQKGEKVFTCGNCGETKSEEIAPSGHSYNAVVTAPTCTEGGYTTYTCSVCGDSYVADEVAATGHDYDCAAVAPSCTEAGYTLYSCSVCGYNYREDGEAAYGHEYSAGVCVNCGEEDPDYLPENPFADVKESDYFFTPVLWAVQKGITNGISATEFGPNAPCTRGQIVTFLWRACGSPEPQKTENPFTDVKPTEYYYKAVLWAVENGITTGMSATTFEPNTTCTRGQVATFLWRSQGKPAPESSENPFMDVKSGEYYYDAVLWAVENGITNGTGVDTFSPDASCTRGQIVTFLYRALAD